MFIVLLKFSVNKENAGQFMDAHKAWIKQGFDENVFLMVGSLKPGAGGVVLAHNSSRKDLEQRVQEDPFVAENIVSAEILEIDPAKADDRLSFLLN
ncbi:YciI family protein [Kiloniella majae]|uniref:YciI family protein n=1 Tax=Kiloniella majae TaxID=1938558 RepID=UPI000A2792CF|nr:YciI family protein [Kiloniella majae]